MYTNFATKVVVISLAIVWIFYSITLIVHENQKKTITSGPIPINRVNVEHYLAVMNGQSILLIDSRAEQLYNVFHLEGAINCTLEDIKKCSLKGNFAYREAVDKDVFVYCTADGCGNSMLVAEFVQYWPVKSINVIDGGLSALLSAFSAEKTNVAHP